MKISFNGFIRRLDMAKESISKFEYRSIEIDQTEIQSEKSVGKG